MVKSARPTSQCGDGLTLGHTEASSAAFHRSSQSSLQAKTKVSAHCSRRPPGIDHGVKTVWLAFPEAREVVVVTARRTKRCRGATLLDASALPDLQISATELFRQLGR